MQLRNARVCLDCEELHEQQQCPVCASEAFAFLTRWVPASTWKGPNRRQPRVVADLRPPTKLKTWVSRGVAGVAVFGISRMLLEAILAPPDPPGLSVRKDRRVAGVIDPAPVSADSMTGGASDSAASE